MDRPDLQSQVDELRRDMQAMQGKVDQTLNYVEEMYTKMGGQKQQMGPMGCSGEMYGHGHHRMYGRPPMGGLFFLISLFLIVSIVTTMIRFKMLSAFRLHGFPGMGMMGGMPFSRRC
jgi:hypothetical protein